MASSSNNSRSLSHDREAPERPEIARTATHIDQDCATAEPAAVAIAEGREPRPNCANAELLAVLNYQLPTGQRRVPIEEVVQLALSQETPELAAAAYEEMNSLSGLLKLRRALGCGQLQLTAASAAATAAASSNCDYSNELNRVLKLRRAISDRKEEGAREKALATATFLLANAAVAVNRANDLRTRHPHCSSQPLTMCYWLCERAACKANECALEEEQTGLSQELLDGIEADAAQVTWQRANSDEFVTVNCAMCVCRLPASCLNNLPLESVNHWYKLGECYPYEAPGGQQLSCSDVRFSRLVSAGSRYMGWGAAIAGNCGAVYAVAMFDTDADAPAGVAELLQPPISVVYADSYTELDVQLR